mmetsp:Transcript_48995/g.150662  ORF Transcript_48995/g.150662 Transcript_48995/m.150662 type:complete len:240 (-) Transcript_48995:510-1229(-)
MSRASFCGEAGPSCESKPPPRCTIGIPSPSVSRLSLAAAAAWMQPLAIPISLLPREGSAPCASSFSHSARSMPPRSSSKSSAKCSADRPCWSRKFGSARCESSSSTIGVLGSSVSSARCSGVTSRPARSTSISPSALSLPHCPDVYSSLAGADCTFASAPARSSIPAARTCPACTKLCSGLIPRSSSSSHASQTAASPPLAATACTTSSRAERPSLAPYGSASPWSARSSAMATVAKLA